MLLARTLALPFWVALNGRNFVEPIPSMPDGACRHPVPCIDGRPPLVLANGPLFRSGGAGIPLWGDAQLRIGASSRINPASLSTPHFR
jgi:hypothetical protein